MEKAIFLNTELCVGCGACAVACMDENDIYPEKGQPAFRRIYQVEDRQFPDNGIVYLSVACRHCEDSPCVIGCPTGAITKDKENGRVSVNQDLCIGCHSCAIACPFDVPRYDAQEKMMKCTLCMDRLEVGMEPACVRVCFNGALSIESANDFQGRKESDLIDSVIKAARKKACQKG